MDFMKKIFTLLIFTLFLGIFSGCNSNSLSGTDILRNTEWNLEVVSDEDGNLIASGENYPDLADTQYVISLSFNEDQSFAFVDSTNSKEMVGTYEIDTVNQVNNTYSLQLYFADTDEPISAVLGYREYENGDEVPSIIFQLNQYIYSFLRLYASEY